MSNPNLLNQRRTGSGCAGNVVALAEKPGSTPSGTLTSGDGDVVTRNSEQLKSPCPSQNVTVVRLVPSSERVKCPTA
jgi:hypothetical protein